MAASQTLAVRFAVGVTTKAPSVEKAAEFPAPTWPASNNRHSPVVEFQILAVRSTAVVKTKVPSGEHAADKIFSRALQTSKGTLESWNSRSWLRAHAKRTRRRHAHQKLGLRVTQTRQHVSSLQVVYMHSSLVELQILMVQSSNAVTPKTPSDENAVEHTHPSWPASIKAEGTVSPVALTPRPQR